MKLGRESAYAIEGLLALAAKPFGTVMLLRDIAAVRGVPQTFLAKIFQKLIKCGIIVSSRGAIRGYALARQPKQIEVRDILLAIEGPELFEHCLFWSNRCTDSNRCPMHHRWKRVKQRLIRELLEGTTLAKLARKRFGGSRMVSRFRGLTPHKDNEGHRRAGGEPQTYKLRRILSAKKLS